MCLVCVCVFSVCVCLVCLVCVCLVCLVCVCLVCVFSVCVCVSLKDTLIAPTLAHYSRLTPTKPASHKNLHPTQFRNPTVIPCCFALPTRA